MPPKPFYEINSQAFLFGKSDGFPEEKVRQWALFELLSNYSICINNIEIERPVKVGTRTHRADIVVLRESAPYVVIECKKWDDKHKGRGMQQAISYADANTMKAQYAVYTNGDVWEVKRRMENDWVDIPDLPKRVDGDYSIKLDELISSINDFMPAFYWLNQTIPANSAYAYFSCLQSLFVSSTFPLNYLNKELLFGTDNLLRVICAKGDHPDYLHGKMVAACKCFSAFLDERGGYGDGDGLIEKDDFWRLTVIFKMKFERIVEDSRGLKGDDVLFVRFISTLLQYLKKQQQLQGKRADFVDVPAVLTSGFRYLMEYLFQIHLGTSFPDPILEESCTNLRSSCSKAWEDYKREQDKTR